MITVEHLTKYYGDFLAVDDLSFEIKDGHVYGFLGPNGAGKSTTMNMITGCLSANDGKVLIDGIDIFENPQEAKRKIGYLPEIPPLYTNETVEEYLKFVAEAKGLKGEAVKQDVARVMEEAKITDMAHRLIAHLSKGYRQRVGIAQALLANPEVIILDEPTVGLDPLQIIEIRNLIKELGKNHTVILSSHILSEVQAICEQVLIISKGKLVAYDAPENLEKHLFNNSIHLVVDGREEKVREILADLSFIKEFDLKEENQEVTAELNLADDKIKEDLKEIFFAFANENIALLEMSSRKTNLEDVFIELTEEKKEEEE